MNEQTPFEGIPDPRGKYLPLAQWLQQMLQTSADETTQQDTPSVSHTSHAPTTVADHERQLELLFRNDYHPVFYQQLPDFIMALLTNDPQATLHYAPLLYHLATCRTCHTSYLDLYDAMRAAVQPSEPRPILGQGTRTLDAMPQRMLGHLCQVLISQAEAVILQARHDHNDADAAARSLLQLALRMSAHITQNGIRRQSLQDLVRVATLFEGASDATQEIPSNPDIHRYTPTLTGAGGTRGKKVVRRTETLHTKDTQHEHPEIQLQSHHLEGTITQQGQLLVLHLHDLNDSLRGQPIIVSVLLGSLIEPIRWLGGNPRSIRSNTPVDTTGAITIPLGETTLNMSNTEEYHLLEAMFMLLEVRGTE